MLLILNKEGVALVDHDEERVERQSSKLLICLCSDLYFCHEV